LAGGGTRTQLVFAGGQRDEPGFAIHGSCNGLTIETPRDHCIFGAGGNDADVSVLADDGVEKKQCCDPDHATTVKLVL
jgi:hypothetical protein